MTQSFLITGCGRSGTQYIARLLCGLGIPCGHETVFNPTNLASGRIDWPPAYTGESSWLAAPFVNVLPDSLTFFHQVRHPLAVVRSFLRIGFFSHAKPFSNYSDWAIAQVPQLGIGDEVERCFRYWLYWNKLVEQQAEKAGHELRRYRIEDFDMERLQELVGTTGLRVEPSAAESALSGSDRSLHTFGDRSRDGDTNWQSLPDGALKDEVLELAARYGYAIETAAAA